MRVRKCPLKAVTLLKVSPGYGQQALESINRKCLEKLKTSPEFFWAFSPFDLMVISDIRYDHKNNYMKFLNNIDNARIINEIYGYELKIEDPPSCWKTEETDYPLAGAMFLKINPTLLFQSGQKLIGKFNTILEKFPRTVRVFSTIGWTEFLIICREKDFDSILEIARELRNLTCRDVGIKCRHNPTLFSHSFTFPLCKTDTSGRVEYNNVTGISKGYQLFSCIPGVYYKYRMKLKEQLKRCTPIYGMYDFIIDYDTTTMDFLKKTFEFWLSDEAKYFSNMQTIIIGNNTPAESPALELLEDKACGEPIQNPIEDLHINFECSTVKGLDTPYNNDIDDMFSLYNEQVRSLFTWELFYDLFYIMTWFKNYLKITLPELSSHEKEKVGKGLIPSLIDKFHFINIQKCRGIFFHTTISYPLTLEYRGGLQAILNAITFITEKTLEVLTGKEAWKGFAMIGFGHAHHYFTDNLGIVNLPMKGLLILNTWLVGLLHEIGHEYASEKKLTYMLPDLASLITNPETHKKYKRFFSELLANIFTFKYGFFNDLPFFIEVFKKLQLESVFVEPNKEEKSSISWTMFLIYLFSEKDNTLKNIINNRKLPVDHVFWNIIPDFVNKEIIQALGSREYIYNVEILLNTIKYIKDNEKIFFPAPPEEKPYIIENMLQKDYIFDQLTFPTRVIYDLEKQMYKENLSEEEKAVVRHKLLILLDHNYYKTREVDIL